MISQKDIGWLVGIIEGEGHIYAPLVKNIRATYYAIRVVVYQKNQEILNRLQNLVGGSIYHSRGCFVWQSPSINGAALIMTIYSEMSQKRKYQIRKALSLWKSGYKE